MVVKATHVDEKQITTVVVLVTDLFFSVKLGNQIKRAGFTPRIVKTLTEFREALTRPDVALGVVDLSVGADLHDLQSKPGRDQPAAIPVIAFGPHKDIDALRDAKAAGVTRVMSNSQFQSQTVEMIRRYARSGTSQNEV